MYWSHFYQSVYEMMPDDRPSDDIIEDDDALDAYMKDYYDEKSRERAASQGQSKNRGKNTAWNHQENIVFKSNPLSEDISYSKTPVKVEKAKVTGKSDYNAAPVSRHRGKAKR
jgi:hypothetical protein